MTTNASPVTSAATIGTGQRVGKYVLTEKLGEGGMGMVFGGKHETLGRDVAIKFLRGEFAANEQVLARFQQEAEAVSRIGHANIVAVYDFGRLDDGSLYYVMERIRGETLTRRLKHDPPLSDEEMVSLFGQTCRALAAAHARNIVHRDLKPDNIMLQPQGSGMPHVKVVDFGVAKMREVGAQQGGGLTRSGTILGTPTYMAPEQITNPMAVDGRADIYALGAMLYEVLTGEPPFGRGDMLTTMQRHVREIPAAPSTKARRPVSPALDAVALTALSKNPADRFADAVSFFADLQAAIGAPSPTMMRQVAEETSTVDRAAAEMVAKAQAPRSRATVVAAAAVAGVLAIAGAGVVVLKGRTAASSSASTHTPAVMMEETPLAREANKVLAGALAGDAQQRRLAVDAMAEVGDHSALGQIITALGDDNPEVRRGAANGAAVLGRADDAELRAALVAAGQRSGGQVAIDVAAARFKTGDATAEDDLRRALDQRDPVSRLRAAVALAGAGKVAAPVLRKAIAGAPPTVKRSLRWAAYVQLNKLGDAAFATELRASLAGNDLSARLDAAQTLARGGDQAGRMALAELATGAADPLDSVDAAAVLAELSDVGAVKTLTGDLDSSSPAVRARAATSLGRLAGVLPGKADLANRLGKQLSDTDPAPRIAAAAAVLALESARAAPRTTP